MSRWFATIVCLLFIGCASQKIAPVTTKPIIIQPPLPPNFLNAQLDVLSIVRPITPSLFTNILVWDTYTNVPLATIYIQGSDDGKVFTNEAGIFPAYITNSYILTNTSSKHFWRLAVSNQ